MIDLGPHASFIVIAYATATVVIFALVGWVWSDHRRQRRLLADLERRGIRRRSDERRPDLAREEPA